MRSCRIPEALAAVELVERLAGVTPLSLPGTASMPVPLGSQQPIEVEVQEHSDVLPILSADQERGTDEDVSDRL